MWLFLILACDTTSDPVEPEPLFGAPSATTGLPDGACQASCACHDFSPPTYTEADLATLRSFELLDAVGPLASDPYLEPPPDRAGVCAAQFEGQGYRLQTYETPEQAQASGAVPTHDGACGVCSTLTDLAAYIAHPDLTEPVRQCGVDAIFGGEAEHLDCLMDLGFTLPCAQIWRFNTQNTRAACLEPCLALLDAPHHDADGALNACLQCDEDESGPVFKAIAGRTRRNSGLASALCRPCETVFPVVHRY